MISIRSEQQALHPIRKTQYSVGYDIFNKEDVILKAFQPMLVATGLWIDKVVDYSYHLDIRPRSSLFKRGVFVQYGTVDPDYRDEILVQIMYIPEITPGINGEISIIRPARIPALSRIAQLVVVRTESLINGTQEETKREGGFGSTGE